STLVVSSLTAVLLCSADRELVRDPSEALLTNGVATLFFFTGLMLASQLGPLRWLVQLGGAAAAVLFALSGFNRVSEQPPLLVVALALPAAGYALAFE